MILLKNQLTIHDICFASDFGIDHFKNVVEIGVAEPTMCRSNEFIDGNHNVTLFEPHPEYFKQIQEVHGYKDNVTLHNVAIGSKKGTEKFAICGQSSFLMSDVQAPPYLTDGYRGQRFGAVDVEVDTFDNYDQGNIDLLLLDTEGAEWFAIQKMVSRPRIIGIETHSENRYRNPYLDQINDWMNENVYKVLFRNTSDTYWIKGSDCGWGKGGNDNWKL